MFDFNERIENLLSFIFQIVVLSVAFLIPLLFWNITTEYFDTPKFLLLTAATALLLIIWFARYLFSGKLHINRTPIDLPILLLLAVFLISTFFTAARPLSIMGNLPRIHGGLVSFIVYILFYFSLVSNLRRVSLVKQIISLLTLSGIIIAVLTLASYAGVNLLMLPWTAGFNFTPTGGSFTTAAILTLLLPFLLTSILQNTGNELLSVEGTTNQKRALLSKMTGKILICLTLTLFAGAIVLVGSWANWVAAVVALGLVLFVTPPQSIKNNIVYITLPLIFTVVLTLVSFMPLGGTQNPFYNRAQNFPREIQLPFQSSWKISISAFRDSPFWGTGPSTYLFNFTTYKPAEFNLSKAWNIRFDTAFNEYLQVLATLGALGLIALLLLTSLFISYAAKAMSSSQNTTGISLAVSGIVFFVLLALHASTLTLWAVGLLIFASFMTTYKNITREVNLGNNHSTQTGYFDLVPIILLVVVVALIGASSFFIGKATLADYHHRVALNYVASGQPINAFKELISAEQLNPYADLYHTDLAKTNFAIANAIALTKGPTEASPGGSLTDADKKNIQSLLGQAINEGRIAVALSPNNPGNWEVLGSIYRQISGVAQNALSFSLDSYGRAISRDPLNPLLRLTVGGIYYSVKNYDLAVRFFTDAANLKPDYANAYFNLAVALRDKSDLLGAAVSAEKTVTLLDPKSQDYKVAAELLAQLQSQISSESAKKQTAQSEPASPNRGEPTLQSEPKVSSALQNKNLPKVLDLPKPEKVATPPAVKKPTSQPQTTGPEEVNPTQQPKP